MSARQSPPEILPNVSQEIIDAYAKEVKVHQPVSNWASKIGHPCARHLVHARLDWERKPVHDGKKELLFNGGKMIERHIAKTYLEKAGYIIVEHNRPVQNESSGLLKRVKIHGALDFVAQDKNGWEFPVEVKGVAPHTWDKVSSIEDMLFSKHFWMRQYPGQLMVYLLGKDYEIGMFLMINKTTFEPKTIWVHQDYTFAEELIKKAELVNRHVDAGTYPDRIPYEEAICGRCDFAKICLQDVVRTEAEVLTDEQLIEDLEERESLQKSRKRFEELDESVKDRLKGIEKGIAGSFMIMGKETIRKNYARGPELEPSAYWKTNIKKLGGNTNGE